MPIRQKSLVLDTIPTIELFLSVQAVSGLPPTTATKHKHEFTYNADGSLDTRYRIDALESGGAHSYKRTSESFDYTYNSLIYEYTSSASYARSGDEGCFDMNNDTYLRWRYRYSPSGEREQKRLVALPNSNSGYPYSLNRSYYLLGGGNRQHAIYEGRQQIFNGPLCPGGASLTGSAVVWAPSEYLMYAGGGTPLVTFLPNGNKEYKILDHLGNTRAIVGSGGSIITEKDYEPFGKTISGVPTLMDNSISPRQGFIGKELDSESDLADHGVRKYDYITGRFMAVDPLWEKYRSLNTYQYAANNPMIMIDPTGFATYYSNGKLILDDGVDDGLEYAVPDDTDLSDFYLKDDEGNTMIGSYDYVSLQAYSFLIPKTQAKADMVNHTMDTKVMHYARPNTEAGGVIAHNKETGPYYIIGGSQTVGAGSTHATASNAVSKAINIANAAGDPVMYTVHTHPFGSEIFPSTPDKNTAKTYPGIIINNKGVTFYSNNDKLIISTVPLSVF
ncbi:MAG: RHS repeat domain-containing protein [Candidatus Kapaibacterium sp.]